MLPFLLPQIPLPQVNSILSSMAGYEEDRSIDAKVSEYLHISNCFEKAQNFDLIHNQFDFVPLCFSSFVKTPLLTTIHGFSSPAIIPVYRKYNGRTHYISISNADRAAELNYLRTIYHGINLDNLLLGVTPNDYLLFFGRMHPDKGAHEAIRIAREANCRLIMAGIIQDKQYFKEFVQPFIDNKNVVYAGSVEPLKRDKLMGSALALLHPISFNEPFGLSVVEAMACGTPSVAFNRGSMPEIISSGKDGFIVDNFGQAIDAVQRINTIDRKECRKTAEERFSAQRMVSEYIQVYKELT